MQDKGADVGQLMEEVAAVVAEPSTVIEQLSAAGRPRVFSLDYVYPHARRLGTHVDMLTRGRQIGTFFEAGSNRKHTGWLVAIAKRLVLLLANWYMKPLTDEVIEFNALVAGALVDIGVSVEKIGERLDVLEKAPAGRAAPGPEGSGAWRRDAT